MTSYVVNIIQVIHRTLIYELRNLTNLRLFYALTRPLNAVSVAFEDFTRQRKRQAKYNGQKMVMERMLNLYYFGQDKWATAADPTASGGIYIEQTSGNVPESFSWNEGETIPTGGESFSWTEADTIPTGGESFSWTEAELVNLNYDFIVKIPSSFVYNESEVRSLVDRYKLGGKNYSIETY